MNKPLELTVYPTFWLSGNLWTTAAPGATISDPIDVDYWAACKRLTDAELAAEYWAATLHNLWHADRNNGAQLLLGRTRAQTLNRFATLPNYDEETL